MKLKKLFSVLLLLALCLTLPVACGDDESSYTSYVRMDFENFGSIVIELNSYEAPGTVKNFQKLVSQGFYDGLTIHRIVPDFVIQGGDPNGDGTGGSKDKIPGEFQSNGFNNNLKHGYGIISMARSSDPDSASSQFFICLSDNASVKNLDGSYAAFGEVVSGMDVIEDIASVPCNGETPIDKVVITRAYFVDGPTL